MISFKSKCFQEIKQLEKNNCLYIFSYLHLKVMQTIQTRLSKNMAAPSKHSKALQEPQTMMQTLTIIILLMNPQLSYELVNITSTADQSL